MQVRRLSVQFRGEKLEDRMRLLRIGAGGGLESQRLEELNDAVRWHPAIRKDVASIENARANELAQNPMEAHVERRRRRVELLTCSGQSFVDSRCEETGYPIQLCRS